MRLLRLDREIEWVATTADEAAAIRAVFASARVHISPEVSEHADAAFVPRTPQETFKLLFLGRIAPRKGLLEAVQIVSELDRPTTLTVAGPFQEDFYIGLVREAIRNLPAHVSVELLGLVQREDIAALIREHDALISPTTGENFGHAIAESLSLGRPVLVTPTTPWNFASETGAVLFIDRADIASSTRRVAEFAAEDPDVAIARQRAAHVVGSRGISNGATLDEVVQRVLRD